MNIAIATDRIAGIVAQVQSAAYAEGVREGLADLRTMRLNLADDLNKAKDLRKRMTDLLGWLEGRIVELEKRAGTWAL